MTVVVPEHSAEPAPPLHGAPTSSDYHRRAASPRGKSKYVATNFNELNGRKGDSISPVDFNLASSAGHRIFQSNEDAPHTIIKQGGQSEELFSILVLWFFRHLTSDFLSTATSSSTTWRDRVLPLLPHDVVGVRPRQRHVGAGVPCGVNRTHRLVRAAAAL